MSGVIIHYGVKGMQWGVRKKEEYRKKLNALVKADNDFTKAKNDYMDLFGPKNPPKRYYNRFTGKETLRARRFRAKQKSTFEKFVSTEEGARLLKRYDKASKDFFKLKAEAYKHGVDITEKWLDKNGWKTAISVTELRPDQKKRVQEAVAAKLSTMETLDYIGNPSFTLDDVKGAESRHRQLFMDNQPYVHRV